MSLWLPAQMEASLLLWLLVVDVHFSCTGQPSIVISGGMTAVPWSYGVPLIRRGRYAVAQRGNAGT